MKLAQLLEGIEIESLNGISRAANIYGISSDSRKVKRGQLFVAIKGLNSDGHDHISEALRNGASAVVIDAEHKISENIPYISLKNTRKALSFLHYNMNGRPASPEKGRMKLIGITGTNGKTTTAALITCILRHAGHKAETIGTLSGNLTTPDPEELYAKLADYEQRGIEYTVMEVSSHALALDKAAPLHFCAGIFTNLTPEHLDFHGTMEEYLSAKSKLFGMCDVAILNGDDASCDKISEKSQAKKVFYSLNERKCQYHTESITHRATDGESYTLKWPSGIANLNTPMPGIFALYNTLAASACTLELGIPPRDVIDAVMAFTGVDGRMERVKLDNADFSVYIDFAHTPDALEKALKLLRSIRDSSGKGRLIVLFGCGGDRDRSKRPVMGTIASRLADLTIVTSDNSRSEEPSEIIKQIVKGIDRERPYKVIENRREAIEYAVSSAENGDIILLAGKGHERYETDKTGKHEFDERVCVRDALKKLRRTDGN